MLPDRVKPVRHVAMDSVPEGGYYEDLGWVCEHCPAGARRVLETFPALRAHEAMVHGLQRPAQHWLTGPECPVCGKCVNSRAIAVEHASRKAPRCAAVLAGWGCPK